MKITPPPPAITADDPYKDALFARQDFGDSLTRLLKATDEKLVLLAHAPWGAGKTTFTRMWRESLAAKGYKAIFFDAYALDYLEDPFLCFTGEILAFAAEHFPKVAKKQRSDLKKVATTVAVGLAKTGTLAAIQLATAGLIQATQLEDVKDVLKDAVKDSGELVAEEVKRKLESYAQEKDKMEQFRLTLRALATAVQSAQGFPLTIVIDELDRCRPAFALALLERLKHLFDVEGVCFVIFVNKHQLESYIKTIYGEVDANAFLLKYANVFTELPHSRAQIDHEYQQGAREYCARLGTHHGLATGNVHTQAVISLGELAEHFSLTLREAEKACVLLALVLNSTLHRRPGNAFLISLLAVLKIHLPNVYYRIRNSRISHKVLCSETRMDNFTSRHPSLQTAWATALVCEAFMSDDELKAAAAAAKAGGIHWSCVDLDQPLAMRYSEVIRTCEALDRFSLQPS